MAAININNIIIESNPAPFLSNFKIFITFECLKELKKGKNISFFQQIKIKN